ncbi:energy-coupling factor transporter transmembrane component T family protein [Clostridium aminobutyricum]|uniref:Energy-coupling factor transporter transmembrane protein EcfT n=1 Tax=Clostridium aminobutyricum TaxID=33953 RepID=A0A939IJH2_CLOAM|nr:energy-coupling factor transporter transmembrane component T [Clostridium aminobutyricum]MBN7774086.1 energy-coupling factor transporter transmembrane protein EcfT [Clostridium aminobutyricum]
MSKSGALYIERNSIFHRLDGSIKLLMLVAWTAFVFAFMDARVFIGVLLLGLAMLKASKLPNKAIWPFFAFILVFTIFNSIFLMIVTPEFGSKLAGSHTDLFSLGGVYSITYETLFYCMTLALKYVCMIPMTILFIFTTHPSSFACSINRLGVSYKIAYAVSIALRYIPDVKAEVDHIIQAQEARGVAFQKGDANIFVRLKNYGTVMIPLLLSSLSRIEAISNAMDLRGFGKNKKRTWYHRKPLSKTDMLFAVLSILVFVYGVALKTSIGAVFWYPF